MPATIDQLIINSPYEEPSRHWVYERENRSFELMPGRRPAGYVTATPGSRAFDDPGIFRELPLVNKIRPRVRAWQESGYPGATGITRRLLDHWNDAEERGDHRFFFCQLEAIETLIWLTEAPAAERVGIDIDGDGGAFTRLCCKMATGSGKTVVMAMLIAWQITNKTTYPNDARFSKNVLVIAPGLTVRKRLQVLVPSTIANFYDEFQVVPLGLAEKLRQGKVLVRNWHVLNWETDEQIRRKRSVDKRGAKSDEAYARDVLDEMATGRNLLVINDEAHHAWRVPAGLSLRGLGKDEVEQATKWIGGLDRINHARGIARCYDFSATPFAPTGHASSEESLFPWIVSDFGLNDAIESGLVKTPRVVVRDDGKLTPHAKSRLYHIYADPEVRSDLNRRAEPQHPLPSLVMNAYMLLGKDWLETKERWEAAALPTPPVMITVANRTETAARVKYAFDRGRVAIDELQAPELTLHIDSKVLQKAEAREEVELVQQAAPEGDETEDATEAAPAPAMTVEERLRRVVDTVGKPGQPGARIQNVISVGKLSEGWDARTVTHVIGLRAFTSQLLCEQVVGRGLRRTSYDVNPTTGLFEPEYVNIFGVPFTFLPHEMKEDHIPPPTPPKTRIEPVPAKRPFGIRWPNIVRIDHVLEPALKLDLAAIPPVRLNALDTPTLADLAPVMDGKPDVDQIATIDLEDLGRRQRWQRIVFQVARDVYEVMQPSWTGNREILLGQVVQLMEQFVRRGPIVIHPQTFAQDDLRRRIVLTLNLPKLVNHAWQAIRDDNVVQLVPVFDTERPIRSTADMSPWYTGKPCWKTEKSHINFCVFDSSWEATESFRLEKSEDVEAWAKNDHLRFEVLYLFNGVVHKYRPDFLIRLTNGTTLVLEVKGQNSEQDRTKRAFLQEWTDAMNSHGGFGRWACDVSFEPGDVVDIVSRHSQ